MRTGQFSGDKHVFGLRGLKLSDPMKYQVLLLLFKALRKLQSARHINNDDLSEEFTWVDKINVSTIGMKVDSAVFLSWSM